MTPGLRSSLLAPPLVGLAALLLTGCVPAADAATPEPVTDTKPTAGSQPAHNGFYMFCTPIDRTPGYYCTPVDGQRPSAPTPAPPVLPPPLPFPEPSSEPFPQPVEPPPTTTSPVDEGTPEPSQAPIDQPTSPPEETDFPGTTGGSIGGEIDATREQPQTAPSPGGTSAS